MARSNRLAIALAVCLSLTACPSGELGERPVVAFDTPATTGTSENVSIYFTISDADFSHSDVTIEYTLDGLTWTPVTVVSSDAGTANGGSIDEIPATPTSMTCTVVWDSWADGVGAAGDATVSLRLTPRDIDGVGESVILPAPIVVNNNVAALVVTETSIDFGTRLARVAETPAQDRLLTITNGSGVFDTFLYWEVTSDQPWLVVSAASGTTPAVPPYQSTIALTADVDGAALTASPTPYQATLTITGWNTDAGGADAYDSPVSIPVTVTVRDPEAEIFIHNGDGSTEVTSLPTFTMEQGGANPTSQSFWIKNAGEAESTLAWTATDSLTTPDWLVEFETTPAGEIDAGNSAEVTVVVDGSGLTAGSYSATITVSGTEKTSGTDAVGSPKTVNVSLAVTTSTVPEIGLSPTSLTFNADPTFGNPPSQTIDITNTGGGILAWGITWDRPWISVVPVAGSTTSESDTVSVSVDLDQQEAWLGSIDTTGAPFCGETLAAVWTGTEMIAWGGMNGTGTPTNQGGRYDPDLDSWTLTSTTGAPSPRGDHTAVWTGTEMLVHGGYDGGVLNEVWRYDPASDTWTQMDATGAPALMAHRSVWTGTEMIVWGGRDPASVEHNTGWRYNPTTNSWAPLAQSGDIPTERIRHIMVWTGSEVIMWGGLNDSGILASGATYAPGSGTWTALPTAGAPPARCSASAIWTGEEIIMWGGKTDANQAVNTGYRYHPLAGTWTSMTTASAPGQRRGHAAVWTGTKMVVFGGYNGTSSFLKNGAIYAPPISLPFGTYAGTIMVSDPGAANNPQAVTVTLNVALDANLVAWWKLDTVNSGITPDSSGNGNDGSVGGAVRQPAGGKIDGALEFSGNGDYVAVADSPSLNPTDAITIAAWINTDTWSGRNARIVQKSQHDTQYMFIGQEYDSPKGLRLQLSGVSGGNLYVPLPSTGAWHHVAGTYDGSTIGIYVDGVLAASQAASGAIAVTNESLHIGTKWPGVAAYASYDGTIDDVRIYSRGLSASEIYQLAGGIDSGLIAHWNLDETSGTTASDSSGNGNDGSFSSLPVWQPSGGAVGGALSFDGFDDYVHVSLQSPTADHTIAAWVKTTTAPVSVMGAQNGIPLGPAHAHEMYLRDDGRPVYYLYDGTERHATGTTAVNDGAWHHIAGGFTEGVGVWLCVDGELQDLIFCGSPASNPYFVMGVEKFKQIYFAGVLDDVRIYGRALNTTEVQALTAMGD